MPPDEWPPAVSFPHAVKLSEGDFYSKKITFTAGEDAGNVGVSFGHRCVHMQQTLHVDLGEAFSHLSWDCRLVVVVHRCDF